MKGPLHIVLDYGESNNKLNMYVSLKNTKASMYEHDIKHLRCQSEKIIIPCADKFLVPFIFWSMEIADSRKAVKVTVTVTYPA